MGHYKLSEVGSRTGLKVRKGVRFRRGVVGLQANKRRGHRKNYPMFENSGTQESSMKASSSLRVVKPSLIPCFRQVSRRKCRRRENSSTLTRFPQYRQVTLRPTVAMCRSVPYLSLKVLLHPPHAHCCVCSLKYGCDLRQRSGLAIPAEEEVDAEVLDEDRGDTSAEWLWGVGILL